MVYADIRSLRKDGHTFTALRRGPTTARRSVVLVPGWQEPRSGHAYAIARLAHRIAELDSLVETWSFDLAGQGESGQPADPVQWSDQLEAVVNSCVGLPWVLTRGASTLLLRAGLAGIGTGVAWNPPPDLGVMGVTDDPELSDGVSMSCWLGAEAKVLADPRESLHVADMLGRSGLRQTHADTVFSSTPWTSFCGNPNSEIRKVTGSPLMMGRGEMETMVRVLAEHVLSYAC